MSRRYVIEHACPGDVLTMAEAEDCEKVRLYYDLVEQALVQIGGEDTPAALLLAEIKASSLWRLRRLGLNAVQAEQAVVMHKREEDRLRVHLSAAVSRKAIAEAELGTVRAAVDLARDAFGLQVGPALVVEPPRRVRATG